MKDNKLAIAVSAGRSWTLPVTILAALALLLVQSPLAHGQRNKSKRIVIENKDEHKAFLGVLMQELSDEVLEGLDTTVKRGVLVTEVVEDSPAEKAGIEEGDIIVEFMGKKVDSPDELRDLVAEQEIGDEVKVKVMRGKRTETLKVALGDWADQPEFAWSGPDHFEFLAPHWDAAKNYISAVWPRGLGVQVSEVNEDLGSYFGVGEGEGVLVLDVHDESTAEALGVKAGDVIVEVEGEEVHSAKDIRGSLSELDEGDEVNVTVVRKKKRVELKGELKEGSNARWHYRLKNHAPRMESFTIPHIEVDDDVRKELDELRKEIDELKKELKKS
jgi:S1-C subfamily serine protease